MPNAICPVVAVLNMKGGVGKTTISAHVFRVLYQRLKKRVLLIDLDPQFNLSQAVFTRTAYDKHKAAGRTLLSVMEEAPAPSLYAVKVSTSPPPDPMVVSVVLRQFSTQPGPTLRIVPGDFALTKYSLLSDEKQLHSVEVRLRQFIQMARQQFDLICIDCNPSSSFLTLCALKLCTNILVPVRPDRYSILGLEMLLDFTNSVPAIHPKPRFNIVLNGLPTQDYKPSVENALRADPTFGPRTLAAKLYNSKALVASADYTGFATDKPVAHRHTLLVRISTIVDELGVALGL